MQYTKKKLIKIISASLIFASNNRILQFAQYCQKYKKNDIIFIGILEFQYIRVIIFEANTKLSEQQRRFMYTIL